MDFFFIASGFTLGLLSSLHCIGMCGPLVMSLPFAQSEGRGRTVNVLLYHTGRITIYALLGLLPGWIGNLFFTAGYQQWFSLAAGVLVLLYFVFTVFARKRTGGFGFVQKLILRFLKHPGRLHFLFIGMANGLLPCGMVYVALSYAAITGHAWSGALFMISFGLGTLPLMAALSFGWFHFAPSLRMRLRRMVPYLGMAIGCLLVLRGMGLGIPYLSPVLKSIQGSGAIGCH